MSESEQDSGSWDDAVSEASQHVVERRDAAGEAAERQKPKPDGPKIAVAIVILLAVVAWNVRALTRPPDVVPATDERSSLVWFVADAAEIIEDFRSDEGRLPNASEAASLLEDDVAYSVSGDVFTLVIDGEVGRTEYSSATPLSEWLAAEGAVESGPPES